MGKESMRMNFWVAFIILCICTSVAVIVLQLMVDVPPIVTFKTEILSGFRRGDRVFSQYAIDIIAKQLPDRVTWSPHYERVCLKHDVTYEGRWSDSCFRTVKKLTDSATGREWACGESSSCVRIK